jgi:hypothetical protein
MTSIWERTASALTGLSIPMADNIKLVATGSALPDRFMVYSLVSSPPEQWADDEETLRSYRMQVSIYDRSGLAALPDVAASMIAAGFGRGPIRELPYDQATRHFGLAMEFIFMEDQV